MQQQKKIHFQLDQKAGLTLATALWYVEPIELEAEGRRGWTTHS